MRLPVDATENKIHWKHTPGKVNWLCKVSIAFSAASEFANLTKQQPVKKILKRSFVGTLIL